MTPSFFLAAAALVESLALVPTRVSSVPINNPAPRGPRELTQTREAFYARVVAEGGVTRRYDVGDAEHAATLYPLSEAKRLAAEDGRWILSVDRPGAYVVDFGEAAAPIHVFAERPWTYVPREGDVYFGPGEHRLGKLVVTNDGTRVVLDRGAVLVGEILVRDAKNVSVVGRGTLRESAAAGRCHMFRAVRTRGLWIEGLVLAEAHGFNLALDDCDDTVIDGVKIIGAWRYNSDGIDVCASRRTTVRNSFVRSYDDCLVARGACPWVADAPLKGMLAENNVLWCDWGKNCEVWAGSRAGVVEDVTFRGNKLVHISGVPMDVTTWFGSADTRIRNILFENQEIDLDAERPALTLQSLPGEKYAYRKQGYCVIGNVDCTALGPENANIITRDAEADYSKYRLRYDNIRFRNVTVLGAQQPLVLRAVADARFLDITNFSCEGLPAGTEVRRTGAIGNDPVVNDEDAAALAKRAIRDRVEFRLDRLQRPVAVLTNRWGFAEVMFWGGRVAKCRFASSPAPLLFEPAAGLDYADVGKAMIHGGIPLMWPWFSSGAFLDTPQRRFWRGWGLPVKPAPPFHGTARYTLWELRDARVDGDTSEIELALRPDGETRNHFPYDFDTRLVVSLGKDTLGVKLVTRNTGAEPFTYGEGFHPYFHVADAYRATMGGFDGCRYDSGRDLPSDATGVWEGGALPLWPGCDTFWMKGDRHVTWIDDPILKRRIEVSARGVRNVVTWFNTLKRPDANLAQAESRHFVCLEPTNYKPETKVTLAPGEEHVFAMDVTLRQD